MEVHKSKRQDNVKDGAGKSDIFVDQFKSVFTKITNRGMPKMNTKCKSNISLLIVTSKGVEKLLASINVKKPTGPDSIPNDILKNCAQQIAPGLCAIFQCSIDTGEFNANVSPIIQEG